MKLTDNFSLSEFACHNGEQVPTALVPNVERLAKNLQVLRDFLDVPIAIVSGYRSKAYNTAIKGAAASQHVPAKAADIRATGVSEEEVMAAIEHLIGAGRMDQGGVGIYDTWVHYDWRGRKARWDNRATGKRG